jgi:hypothetical protein
LSLREEPELVVREVGGWSSEHHHLSTAMVSVGRAPLCRAVQALVRSGDFVLRSMGSL